MGTLFERGTTEKRTLAMVTGLSEEFPDGQATFMIGGQERTIDDMKAGLLEQITANRAMREAAQTYREAREERQAVATRHKAKLEEAILFVKCLLGTHSPKLTSFGLEVPKPRRRPTTEQQLAANAKRAAHRQAKPETAEAEAKAK